MWRNNKRSTGVYAPSRGHSQLHLVPLFVRYTSLMLAKNFRGGDIMSKCQHSLFVRRRSFVISALLYFSLKERLNQHWFMVYGQPRPFFITPPHLYGIVSIRFAAASSSLLIAILRSEVIPLFSKIKVWNLSVKCSGGGGDGKKILNWNTTKYFLLMVGMITY